MMTKMESDKFKNAMNTYMGSLRMRATMFEISPQVHDLLKYEHGFTKYFGCGNRLYFLANEYDEAKMQEITGQRIHPSKMVKQLSEFMKDFAIVMVDVEMGGISVFSSL